jgi:hypothetical protein
VGGLILLLPAAIAILLYFALHVSLDNDGLFFLIPGVVGLLYFRSREDVYIIPLWFGTVGGAAVLILWLLHR